MDQPSGTPKDEKAGESPQAEPAVQSPQADPAMDPTADPTADPSGHPAPPPLDDDEDVIDAEIVEPTAGSTSSASAALPAPDYSEAGVPSLDYLRDKVEGRYATALGSTELAQAAAEREAARRAAVEADKAVVAQAQRVTREQAAKDKLEEIRRSMDR